MPVQQVGAAPHAAKQMNVEDGLIERLRNSDDTAFDEIFRATFAELVRYVRSLIHDPVDAEDVVQDVFASMWRNRQSLRADSSLRSYLFVGARNRALNVARHRRIADAVPLTDSLPALVAPTDSDLREHELQSALEHAIASLSPRCREVFELSRYHGMPHLEIAALLGLSKKTVEAHIGTALRLLRERLAPWLSDSTSRPD